MKRIFLVMLGALAIAGSLKAEVVEYHGYLISSEDTGKFAQSEIQQIPVVAQPLVGSELKPASEPHNEWVGVLEFMLLVAVVVALYFLPAFIARPKRNFGAIFVLNLFAGWSFIGWLIALVWACTAEAEKISTCVSSHHVSELGQ